MLKFKPSNFKWTVQISSLSIRTWNIFLFEFPILGLPLMVNSFEIWRLDVGDGKEINLEKCPRSKLHRQCIKYLGPVSFKTSYLNWYSTHIWLFLHFVQAWTLFTSFFYAVRITNTSLFFLCRYQNEREAYEVIVENGKLLFSQSGVLVETDEGSKWIFVLSTSKNLYVGQKKKGAFQHSSFLSGGAITAAGRLVAHQGVLEVNI